MIKSNEYYMNLALLQAKKAREKDEIPIGAVIVDKDGKVVARGYNRRNKTKNAIEHAEIVAITRACKKINDWRLNGCKLFVTLEPCGMCAGACVNARIDEIVFGAKDNNGGCCGTLINLVDVFKMNHTTTVIGGICEKECSEILTDYFVEKRQNSKNDKKM